MDNFNTLWNRLQNRAAVGPVLAKQLIQDSWHTLQARKEWSWRRRSGSFAPPDIYLTGTVSTNVDAGNPFLITGVGTTWTPQMIGRQIRIGGLLYPYYTIQGWVSATQILIDQAWAGPDVSGQVYNILQCYFPVPDDFGYFEVAVSIKDGYRLWTNVTEADLALMDPQRTNQGQTYAVAFRDFTSQFGGVVGTCIPVTNALNPAPISTTSVGFTYPADATYVVQVVTGGVSGTATFQWLRAGQAAFQPVQTTSDQAQDLSDGVQIYWPLINTYIAGDLFVINCTSQVAAGSSVPRYELWPAPTYSSYLYPYIYYAKEYDLTDAQPQLPPPIANRGEVLLEMALAKCAAFPGVAENPNAYYDLKLAGMHEAAYRDMLIELENTDENIGVTKIMYQEYPFYPAPWMDGNWQQQHAPFLNGF